MPPSALLSLKIVKGSTLKVIPGAHVRSQRHSGIREGGEVRQLQPRSACTKHAGIDRQPKGDVARGSARRHALAADDAQAEPDGPGPNLLRSVQRAAQPS